MKPIQNTIQAEKVYLKALYAECFHDDGSRLSTTVHMFDTPITICNGDSVTITWTINVRN